MRSWSKFQQSLLEALVESVDEKGPTFVGLGVASGVLVWGSSLMATDDRGSRDDDGALGLTVEQGVGKILSRCCCWQRRAAEAKSRA